MTEFIRGIWGRRGYAARALVRGLVIVLLAMASYALYDGMVGSSVASEGAYEDYECSVMGIDVHGALFTYTPVNGDGDATIDSDIVASEEILYLIDQANIDDSVQAVLVEIDSLGGFPVAGEEVANALRYSKKPTVAVIRQSGLSAAYWAATGADYIFASRNSDVGGIGVTSSYLQNVRSNHIEGFDYVQLSSGKYKDAGDPDRPLTAEERQIFMRDVIITHENFIEDVATNRNMTVEDVRKISDGSSVLGARAKELGLIDEVGGMIEVEEYLDGIIGKKPDICWY